MKLSIAWIFDHIEADWRNINIPDLVALFNQKCAEIEGFEHRIYDLKPYAIAQVKALTEDAVTLLTPEWKKNIELPMRSGLIIGNYYLIKKENEQCRWALLEDFRSAKEGLWPALKCDEREASGAWREQFGKEDYILEVDNKSITHRPDMWGHRGFAREIAAILNLPLRPLEELMVHKTITNYSQEALPTGSNPFSIANQAPEECKRFAGLYFSEIEHHASHVWMASRLMRVDARPIDALVDITNYVMLDLSQPLHAFDAEKIATKSIVPRMAKKGEKLQLLDEQEIELTPQDLIISDGSRPLALAGIMGGKGTGVSPDTTSLFLESANFDATTIRLSAARFKVRTEASARFEKTLDPNQNILGILRFLNLLDRMHIGYVAANDIASLGAQVKPQTVTVKHHFIEDRLGVKLEPTTIKDFLERIEFHVELIEGSYAISIPTFRATKDVDLKEDIVEEVGRLFGYANIIPSLPTKQTTAHSLHDVMQIRALKDYLAFGCQMREVYNYGCYDEEFLRMIAFDPTETIGLKNPVSEHWRRMTTSLLPGLFKAITTNIADFTQLRFFEWARIWHKLEEINEQRTLSGVLFEQKKYVDFYDGKALLEKMFNQLGMPITWVRVNKPTMPWYMPYQTARLMYNDRIIGTAGKVNQQFLTKIVPQGDAFVFELNGDALLAYKKKERAFKPLPKFPPMRRDISMLVPLSVTVDEIQKALLSVNKMISDVILIDFFRKKEWDNQKSLTFNFLITNNERTLTGQEADALFAECVAVLKKYGAQVR